MAATLFVALSAYPALACFAPADPINYIGSADTIFAARIKNETNKGEYLVLDVEVSRIYKRNISNNAHIVATKSSTVGPPIIRGDRSKVMIFAVTHDQESAPGEPLKFMKSKPPRELPIIIQPHCGDLLIFADTSDNVEAIKTMVSGGIVMPDKRLTTPFMVEAQRAAYEAAEKAREYHPRNDKKIATEAVKHLPIESAKPQRKSSAATIAVVSSALALCAFLLIALLRRIRRMTPEG